ncbi:MAG: DUF4395 domain-containing protein, partial [Acidimicrobiia bacterium]
MPTNVDVNIPRFNQAMVAGLTGLAFVLQWPWLVAIVFLVLAATRFMGPRAALFTLVYLRWVRPRLDGPREFEEAAPPRFAQLLGTIFLGAAT